MKRFAQASDKAELIKLYNECFPCEEEFCRKFFDNLWKPENTLVDDDNGSLLAMLQMLPIVMKKDDKEYKAYYIYAAATKTASRRQGRMSELIRFAEELNQDCDLAVLIAGSEELTDYYSRLGFKRMVLHRTVSVCESIQSKDNAIKYETVDSSQAYETLNSIYEENLPSVFYNVRTVDDWKRNFDYCDLTAYACGNGDKKSYVIVEKCGNGDLKIKEAIGGSWQMLAEQILFDLGICAAELSCPLGMAKTLQGQTELLETNCYVNLLYN